MSSLTETPRFGWTQWGDERCYHPNLPPEHNVGTSGNGRFMRGHTCPDCGTTWTHPWWLSMENEGDKG